MNRYLVFAGKDHYPAGGWKDCVGTFNELNVATEAATDRDEDTNEFKFDWWHIFDRDHYVIVREGINEESENVKKCCVPGCRKPAAKGSSLCGVVHLIAGV